MYQMTGTKGFANKYKETSPWYDGYIELATQLGITKNIVHPGNWEVSRALVAQLIYNFIHEKSIPVLYFSGNLSNMTNKKDERKITVSYKSNNISFDCYAKIKLQGTSSLAYNKKNYTATFVGYFPADDPKYSCIIVVSNPRGKKYYHTYLGCFCIVFYYNNERS